MTNNASKKEKEKSASPTMAELRFMAFRIRKSPLSLLGLFIIMFFVLMAVAAPIISPKPYWDISPLTDPFVIPRASMKSEPAPPTALHPMGLAPDSYDMYYGVIWGTITAFRVGVYVVALSLIIGLTVGLAAGYYGGLVDETLMRFTDVIIAFPGLVLSIALVTVMPDQNAISIGIILLLAGIALGAIVLVSVVGRSFNFKPKNIIILIASALALIFGSLMASGVVQDLTFLIVLGRLDKVLLALVLVGWPGYTRVIRGEVLRTRTEDYVESAKAIGCSDVRIITRHIVPNAIYPILILASLDIGSIVLSAAALSFLGIGAPTNYADWGQLMQRSQDYLGTGWYLINRWWVWVIPGVFMFMFSLGWNLLGDAIRDILDPTLRRR